MARPIGEDDEMDLINAEFESMVSGLSLDQSSPSTYLDELDAIESADSDAQMYALPPREKKNLHQHLQSLRNSLLSWWNRGDRDDDGAQL
jgi:arginine repressor